MTTTQVVKSLVTVNNSSPIQDYVHPDDYTQPTYRIYSINHPQHFLDLESGRLFEVGAYLRLGAY